MEWRRVVETSNETGRKTIEANAKSFEERYGKNVRDNKLEVLVVLLQSLSKTLINHKTQIKH